MMCVAYSCLHAYICCYLPMLDSNDNEGIEDGEIFQYYEEDQGQAE
jgi:hypothetical protein